MRPNVTEYSPDEHREVFEGWCDGHGVQCPPEEILPPIGLVTVSDGIATGMCWLYMDVKDESGQGSGVCHLAWQTTNPNNSAMASHAALKAMDEVVCELMRAHNYGFLFVMAQPEQESYWQRLGFTANHIVKPMFKEVV